MPDESHGTSWPEQDIIRAWIEKHQIDLPHEVTFELAERMTEIRLSPDDSAPPEVTTPEVTE
jgi:hypothetical protein